MNRVSSRLNAFFQLVFLLAVAILPVACGSGSNGPDEGPESCKGDECEPPQDPDQQPFGICQGEGCISSCPASAPDVCDGRCVNSPTDPEHCGGCGRRCGEGSVCSEGKCGASCGGSTPDLCDGLCVDSTTDVEHCGGCGQTCKDAEVCVDGSCRTSCPSSAPVECDRLCINPWDDPDHCGACNRACSRDQLCSDGECLDACGGTTPSECGSTCRDLLTDPKACGACDTTCEENQVCSRGSCEQSCDGGSACDGQCVDLSSDARHCGVCGRQCLAGAVCVDGTCASSCPQERERCGSSCVSFEDDPQHCGACGNVCPAAQRCVGGECSCAGAGHSLCGDSCVELARDEANCGKCGTKCPLAQTCEKGRCACPDEVPNLCDDTCVDFATDDLSCGECGKTCGDGTKCEAGVCKSRIVELDYNDSVLCALYDSSEVLCVGGASPYTGEPGYFPAKVANIIEGYSAKPVQVDLGSGYGCALLENGKVECWGYFYGFMGEIESSPTPLPLDVPHTAPVTRLAVGNGSWAVLHDDGKVTTWGSDNYGMSGHAGTDPGLVEGLSGAVVAIDSMPAGMCARLSRDDGAHVQCWGLNQTIFGTDDPATAIPPTLMAGLETPDEGVELENSLAMSYGTTCVIVGAGELACWGENYYGKLAVDPDVQGKSDTPILVEGLPGRVKKVAMTQHSVCALLENRDLYCWGTGYGAAYDPDSTFTHEPTLVLTGVTRLDHSAIVGWFAFVEDEGQWYSWGGPLGREYGDTQKALPCCEF